LQRLGPLVVLADLLVVVLALFELLRESLSRSPVSVSQGAEDDDRGANPRPTAEARR
jgi:hypothetical protein